MKSIFVAAAALAGMAAFPALAASSVTAKPNAETGAPAKADPDRRYCFVDTVTGSRIAKKVCKSRADWAADGVDMTQFDR